MRSDLITGVCLGALWAVLGTIGCTKPACDGIESRLEREALYVAPRISEARALEIAVEVATQGGYDVAKYGTRAWRTNDGWMLMFELHDKFSVVGRVGGLEHFSVHVTDDEETYLIRGA